MIFWQLERPSSNSDYKDAYINGELKHSFGLPGVDCKVCGDTWGSSRILPYTCPPALRKNPHIRDRWPISPREHKALQGKVRRAMRAASCHIGSLEPGDEFQPCTLSVPSRPSADFLWASPGSVVVSERIRSLFESLKVRQVRFCPVRFGKIGNRSPRKAPPMPSTGEPEDIISEVSHIRRIKGIGPYYELVILSESGLPPGGEPISICRGCGHKTLNQKRRKLAMEPRMWKGEKVFYLATTLRIIVIDQVKQGLERIKATNIAYKGI